MKALLLCLALIAGPAFATGETPPAAPPADSWTGPDKKLHFAVSAIVSFAAMHQTRDPWKSFAIGVGVGVLKELSDEKFSTKDLVWDIAGAAVGVQVGSWTIRPNKIMYSAAF